MIKVLGISAFYHDSAATLIVDGKVLAAAQEERFTRVKHTAAFPTQAIRYCLEEGGMSLDDLDAVVFYDKPFLKFERLLESYYAYAPKGLLSFLKAIPVWLNDKLFLKSRLMKELKQISNFDKRKMKLLFSEHHLSHAASAFYPSSYEKSAILTIDGVGEWCTASIGIGEHNSITILREMWFPHSLGLLYSAFTYFLGFTVNSGEYKLMGLAPYGNQEDDETLRYIEIIKGHLVSIKEDGSIWLNQDYFSYAYGLKMVDESKWKELFGISRRIPETELTQQHCNLALAIQKVTEEVVIKMAQEAKRLTGLSKLCLSGGVALNCVANGKLLEEKIFEKVFVQPASGDAGGSMGAALAAYYLHFGSDRKITCELDEMQGSFLGPYYSDKEIERTNRFTKAIYKRYSSEQELCSFVAEKIKEGNIIGWFQGRMEFGPRALGNRSILADPSNKEMQKKLNLKIKYREGFRPFAPSVLEEYLNDYFETQTPSPFMLFVSKVKSEHRVSLPKDFSELNINEKLHTERSRFQAITHVDFSARVQTVNKQTNPRFWCLLSEFNKQTGVPMLINTSFNVRGEPMVCTPLDAYRCFMSTEMDYLVLGEFVYFKLEQPDHTHKEKWKIEYSAD